MSTVVIREVVVVEGRRTRLLDAGRASAVVVIGVRFPAARRTSMTHRVTLVVSERRSIATMCGVRALIRRWRRQGVSLIPQQMLRHTLTRVHARSTSTNMAKYRSGNPS